MGDALHDSLVVSLLVWFTKLVHLCGLPPRRSNGLMLSYCAVILHYALQIVAPKNADLHLSFSPDSKGGAHMLFLEMSQKTASSAYDD